MIVLHTITFGKREIGIIVKFNERKITTFIRKHGTHQISYCTNMRVGF